MKEHVQKPGVRQWAGEDLIELQAEPLRAVEGFFSEYGSCVIKGCIATANEDGTHNISAGLLGLWGTDAEGNRVYKTVPFSGITGIVLPVYFTLSYSTVERAYADNKVKPIAYDYRAAVSTVQPESGDYLALTEAGAVRFTDVIQDAGHRFVTEAERTKLSGIEAGANKYIHPATHPAGMIIEDAARRFFSDTERTKLSGIEAGANKYIHPATHPAGMIIEDAARRFFSDTERAKLNGIEAGANKYIHPATHPASMIATDTTHRFVTDITLGRIGLIPSLQNKLNGIEAGANKYTHPATHPASMIVTDANHRFITDVQLGKFFTSRISLAKWIDSDQAYEFAGYMAFAIIAYRIGPYAHTPWRTALITRWDTTFYLGEEGDDVTQVSRFSFDGLAIKQITNPLNKVTIITIAGFDTTTN